MKAKRIVMAVAVLVLVIAMACALVSCDFFGGGSGDKDTTYEVTVQCDTSLGSVSGGGKFKQGDSVTIIATANEGYSFIGWYDGETKVSDQAEWTFSMGEKAISCTAKFSVNSYTVNLDCDLLKGSVTGGGNYEYGSSVTITATANTGYSFVGWYDGENVISTNAEYTFNMGDNNIAWTAKFSINKYVINLDCETEQGTVTGGGEFTFGSRLTIIAEEKAGYKFIGWYDGETLVSKEINYTFTCINNANYNAKFEKLNLVQISCDLEQGSVTGGGEYNNGESVTITATAKTGYSFVGWYDGTTLVSTDVRYTFVMGSNGVNYTAKFKANQYSLTLECNSEQGTVTGSGEYDYGSSVTITATENIGYIFDAWYDGTKKISEQANYTFTMVAKNVTYTAKYTTDTNYEKLKLTLLDDGTYKITDVTDSSISNIKIPNYVSSIGNWAFSGCSSLTSVTIPDSVISIGEKAFYNCKKISEICYTGNIDRWCAISGLGNLMGYGSNKKLYIGGSEITELVIPDSVTSIGDYAFYDCSSLASITIPDSVTSIGEYAFRGCSSLASITIPDSVTSIGEYAFRGCSSLTSISIPNSVTSIGDSAFLGCRSLASVIIPNSVTSIGKETFYGCSSLTSITVPNSVTSIGERAFEGCSSLTSVIIPDSVTSFGERAFEGCSSLTSVIIPDSVTSFGERAFYNCSSLTSISIPNSVTSIGDSAFEGCGNLTSVTIPDSVTSIGNYAFRGCSSLTSVTIPNSVTSIGSSAFYDCRKISEVKYSGTIVQWLNISGLDDLMRYGSNKKLYIGDNEIAGDLVIPNSVTSIGGGAFYGCSSLASVIIPDSVTSIGKYAFQYCSGLTSVSIPDSVTSIGYDAFRGCSGFTNISIPNSVTSIGSGAFAYCSNLINVTIPDSVTSIGYDAFYNCSSLTSVTIPDSVTSIDWNTFYNCSSLTSVTIPDSVTSIAPYAFYNCSSLTSVTIGNNVTSIGDWAFYGCSSLTSVTIPDSVTNIGLRAFSDCYALAEIYNLSSLNIAKGSGDYGYVAYYARDVYTSLSEPSKLTEKDGMILHTDGINVTLVRYIGDATSIIIPDNVTSIGHYAFFGCRSLTKITIPNSVTSIGSSAFAYCSALTSITIPNSVTSIGDLAFYDCFALAEVYNLSNLNITKGSVDNGNIAYYALDVYNSLSEPSKLTEKDGMILHTDGINITLVRYIGDATSIIIPDNVTSIGHYAFFGCRSLTKITIPNSVTSIGEYAFYGCSNISEVKYNGTIEQWLNISGLDNLMRYSSNKKLYIGGNELTELVIPDGITSIGSYAFYGCTGLTSVTIGNSVTSIGDWAFLGCSALTSVTFENTTGWFVSKSSDATSGINVYLTDPSQNAVYLKDTYYNYYWKRG